jgi:hypothetical protein
VLTSPDASFPPTPNVANALGIVMSAPRDQE